ncbi:T9SS type B sorting domain-containing protein [Zhouia sp. PK063]|uniref:T9SS type B sorting domain-containing protein n=1 Tax=Zhouia sp. PK063 TaxID=3373602 RepID=UPI0037AB21B1
MLSFVCSTRLFSQEIIWQKNFGGSDTDWCNEIITTQEGNLLAIGYSYSPASGNREAISKGFSDGWLVKINQATGAKILDKAYGGKYSETLMHIAENSDGMYYLGGESAAPKDGDKTEDSRGNDDYWILKLDQQLNVVWNKVYGGNDIDRINCIKATDDGGCLVGGFSYSYVSGDKTEDSRGQSDIWILKLNKNGDLEWQKTFGSTGLDNLSNIIKAVDGGYIICGTVASSAGGDLGTKRLNGLGEYWVIHISNQGNIIWQKTYGGDNGDNAPRIVQTQDNNYFIAGTSTSKATGDKAEAFSSFDGVWALKIDINGNILWQKNYEGNSSDFLDALICTSDGGFGLGISTYSSIGYDKTEANQGNNERDYWFIKLDNDGNVIWDKTIGGDDLENVTSLTQTNDGNFVIAGWSDSSASGNKTENTYGGRDYFVVKVKNSEKPEQQESSAVIYYPTFFTPNNDNINDFWKIDGTFKQAYIFNRYGKLLKVLNMNNKTWDGTCNGVMQPSDDYWVKIVNENDSIIKTHFTLKR